MSEKELVLAVIQQAVADATINPKTIHGKGARNKAEMLKRTATAWLKESPHFDWYCGLVELDPRWAREKIVGQLSGVGG